MCIDALAAVVSDSFLSRQQEIDIPIGIDGDLIDGDLTSGKPAEKWCRSSEGATLPARAAEFNDTRT
jgi:hypothetical protein